MIPITFKPSEFQTARNEILYKRLKPLRDELAGLPELQKQARGAADIDEVRRIKNREVEIHESLVRLAAEAKKELQTFVNEFSPLANAECKRVDDELAAKTAARETLRRDYERQDKAAEQEIGAAQIARNTVWSAVRSIFQMNTATMGELREQIEESLKVA